MASPFQNVFKWLATAVDSKNETRNCQDSLIDNVLFYKMALAPAMLIVISFAFTQTRRRMYLNVMKGRPGLVHPMYMMSVSDRLSYACAFGSTVYLIFSCIFNGFRVIQYDGLPVVNSLLILVSVFIFGLVHYPVFACLTVGSAYGYGLGALYIWMLTIVSFIHVFSCSVSTLDKVRLFFRHLPYLACLLYLCLSIPTRFYKATKRKVFFVHHDEKWPELSLQDIKQSYIGQHVYRLSNRPAKTTDDVKGIAKALNFIRNYTYKKDNCFRYSARLLSTLLVAFIVLYSLSFTLSVECVIIFYKLHKSAADVFDDPNSIELARHILGYVAGITMSTLAIASLLGLYSILRIFVGYRDTMYKMYRGQLKEADHDTLPEYLLVGSMKFSGYQVVYVVYGFVLHSMIFFIICAVIAFFFGVLINGYYQWLTWTLVYIVPVLLWSILIGVLQRCVGKHCFLQKGQKQKSLDLNNRRALFIFTYFTFFYNIFLGFFSSTLRLIKGLVIGAILFPRLDHSTLPARYQRFDNGHVAYLGFATLECAQTHPVMICFLQMLACLARQRANCTPQGQGGSPGAKYIVVPTVPKQRAARFNWFVLITLINNPDLRMTRKGYVHKLKRAKILGLELPKTDTYVDIDRVLLEADCTDDVGDSLVSKAFRAAGDRMERGVAFLGNNKKKNNRRRVEHQGDNDGVVDIIPLGDVQGPRHLRELVI